MATIFSRMASSLDWMSCTIVDSVLIGPAIGASELGRDLVAVLGRLGNDAHDQGSQIGGFSVGSLPSR